jgi:hypothetical protein
MAGGYDANSSTAAAQVTSTHTSQVVPIAFGGVLAVGLILLARRRYND